MNILYKKILLSIASVLICFFIIELLLVMFGIEPKEKENIYVETSNVSKKAIDNQTFIEDRFLLWKLRPSSHFIREFPDDRFYGEYKINSLGLRGKDFLSKKPEKVSTRVICIGDSITFGWRVAFEDAYPGRLDMLLKKQYPNRKVEVINAGVLGYSSLQGLRFLKRDILKLDPDIVVIYFGVNDGDAAKYFGDKDISPKSDFTGEIENFLVKFRSYRLLRYALLKVISSKESYNEDIQKKTRVSLKDYRKNIEVMVQITSSRDIPLLIVVPLVYEDGYVQKHELYDITKYLNVQLTDRSVRYINLLPRFREVEDGKFLFFDNSHPTELGHKIIAEEILKVLISDDLL